MPMHDTGSVRSKLILMAVATTVVALLSAGVAMLLLDLRTFQRYWVEDLTTQADIVASVTAPAVSFNDVTGATQNLRLLRLRPQIVAAAVYTANGERFATYAQPGVEAVFPAKPEAPGYRIEQDDLHIFRNIVENGEILGSVYVRSRYGLLDRMLNYGAILGGVLLAALVIAALVASRLQASITRPLEAVTNVARQVMLRRDFSLRVPGNNKGEIGVLVEAFNDMLAEIGRRSEALQTANRTLEHEMEVRQRAEQALIVADRRKDEFLATLAHELRNPLAPIRTGLDILRIRSGDAAATQRATDIMERQLRQMVRLVDDLLDVSRINTGKFTIKMGRVELKAVVNDALEVVRSYIELHGHELVLDLPDRPVFLHGDATRLAQILSNLLNNAAKYTNRGGKVELKGWVEDKTLVLEVADTGIGLAPNMLDSVFEMFVQVDSTLERSNAGLGVGLSLARKLVELHGGTISAHSEGLGHGSRFVVRLPIVVDPEPLTKPTPATFISTESYRILLADDNVDFVNSIGALLTAMGHSVVITHNGPDALAAAARFCPDYAFLDIGLPHMSGYDLARGIRKLSCGAMTVLIAVTGWGQEKDRQLAFEAGFDHHMVKPVRFEQIEEILGNRSIIKKLRT
ncbi:MULTISPECIES: ATP-binding protein [unclassified Massilia]|uniref:hybrid sensor histidine kinase/response regulator n=1 Tax=unclassified Massilia TaxID=2609279 RepID=UPI001B830663|nr:MULTISPECIES: ATP-binding protein [unclassified Massilia]MBQ5939812.1 response regulator [Massilia sp. AB1]MBQ5963092.1 response regulator [Massilia sp. ZL223]